MASSPPRIATLDACVLYQDTLTDLLLRLSTAGAIDPIWSPLITQEWTRHLSLRLDPIKVTRRATLMDEAFPTASVAASSRDIETIQAACRSAAQRKDAHVVATALQARAGTIVTHDIPDFYQAILDEYGLIKRRPNVFLVELMSTHPALIIAGANAHRASLKTPALSVDDYLAELAGAKASVPKFARALEQHHKADI